MGKPSASEQACREPCARDLSALVTRWANGVYDNTERRDWPGLVSGQTFPSCESTQPLAKQLRIEGPKEKVWFYEVLQKQNDEVSKGWVVEWL